jgi:hypothetical protein
MSVLCTTDPSRRVFNACVVILATFAFGQPSSAEISRNASEITTVNTIAHTSDITTKAQGSSTVPEAHVSTTENVTHYSTGHQHEFSTQEHTTANTTGRHN